MVNRSLRLLVGQIATGLENRWQRPGEAPGRPVPGTSALPSPASAGAWPAPELTVHSPSDSPPLGRSSLHPPGVWDSPGRIPCAVPPSQLSAWIFVTL